MLEASLVSSLAGLYIISIVYLQAGNYNPYIQCYLGLCVSIGKSNNNNNV